MDIPITYLWEKIGRMEVQREILLQQRDDLAKQVEALKRQLASFRETTFVEEPNPSSNGKEAIMSKKESKNAT